MQILLRCVPLLITVVYSLNKAQIISAETPFFSSTNRLSSSLQTVSQKQSDECYSEWYQLMTAIEDSDGNERIIVCPGSTLVPEDLLYDGEIYNDIFNIFLANVVFPTSLAPSNATTGLLSKLFKTRLSI